MPYFNHLWLPMNKRFTIVLFLLFVCTKIVFSQQTFPVNGTTEPKHITYAFKNATIFIDYKTVVSPATLIIRDGIILDVGVNVSIPPDAVIEDIRGFVIYPSFIDIYSDYGLPEVRKPASSD